MEEQSFHEKEGFNDNANVHRLSESRPIFKPVLVKKLLADESDDTDSDDQAPNSDNSDEEFDDFQPLPEECTSITSPKTLITNADVDTNIAVNDGRISAVSGSIKTVEVDNVKTIEKVELIKTSDNNIKSKEGEQKSTLNSYLKDSLKISEYVMKKNEDKPISGAKRKSCKVSTGEESVTSQWQPMPVTILDKRKSLPVKDQRESSNRPKSYSPDIKRHSNHLAGYQVNENKEKSVQHFECLAELKDQKPHRISSTNLNKPHGIHNEAKDEIASGPSKAQVDQMSNTKCSSSQPVSNAVMDTPMKHPPGPTRPNPCLSHRNIFQTPQNKLGNEFAKNPMQTPATIFSHWSQQHMAQTPMQNQISTTRESLHTPASSIAQSQSTRHETPRYINTEGKSVRRPLAETMFSSAVHGPQLPKLQEVTNESRSSPPVPRDSNNAIIQDSAAEKKSAYSSLHVTLESKENSNPNAHLHDLKKHENHGNNQPKLSVVPRDNSNAITQDNIAEKKPVYSSTHVKVESKESSNASAHDVIKYENHGTNQPKLSVPEGRHSINTHSDIKPKLEYQNNVYHNNIQAPRTVENYENYQVRESQSVHPPVTNQPEQRPISCSISQQSNAWNSRQNRTITVQGRQYLVLGLLGQGMSCEVVRAQDLVTSDLRAIKCVNLSKMDKDSAQGCLQEICLLDKLRAPCIVHMYNFEIQQPWVHVVMEIGDTDFSRVLKSMLQEKKQIPLTMILYYWTEMLTAVKHIHDNGTIHSDLKPANFLLVRGRLKLIDFGIASNINSDMTSVLKNCPIGTLNYISPEAMVDINAGSNDSPNHNVKYKISYKSDVWSLGCILYGLVYGVTPFNHIRPHWAKVSAITDPKHKINFPLENGSDLVPLILIDVMRKCLQHDPKARPTVAELLEIPYLQGNISPPVAPNIPPNILIKIKHALSDEEWQELTEILDKRWKHRG